MYFIKDFISTNSRKLTVILYRSGFNIGQACRFLPEITPKITDAFNNTSCEEIISGETSPLLRSINVDEIATSLDMSTDQVRTGLELIIPDIQSLVMPFTYH